MTRPQAGVHRCRINVTCEQSGQYQVYANFEEKAPAASSHTRLMPQGCGGWRRGGFAYFRIAVLHYRSDIDYRYCHFFMELSSFMP